MGFYGGLSFTSALIYATQLFFPSKPTQERRRAASMHSQATKRSARKDHSQHAIG